MATLFGVWGLGQERLPSSFLLRMEVIVMVKGVEKGLNGDREGTAAHTGASLLCSQNHTPGFKSHLDLLVR